MSQFVLIERALETNGHPAVVQSEIHHDLFKTVATQNFGDWRHCRLVTDVSHRGEPLIDDVWDAQMKGNAIEETAIARFLEQAVTAGIRFVIWCSDDFSNLPVAHRWDEVVEQLRAQTRLQPADVYLSFAPLT